MAFSVHNFKSRGLVNGGARPSLFDAYLEFPGGVDTTRLTEGGRFLIKAAQIPAASVDSVDVPYFGRKVKVAGDRTFADWTVTIMNDEDFIIRDAMESWSNLMNQLEGNFMVSSGDISGGNRNGYKTDLYVRQYAKAAENGGYNPTRVYKFVGAFPTSVDSISLDWDRTNTVEEFDVTFAYDYWVPVNEGTFPITYDGQFGVVSQ